MYTYRLHNNQITKLIKYRLLIWNKSWDWKACVLLKQFSKCTFCAPNSCRLYKSTIWHFEEMLVRNVETNTLLVGNYLSVSLGDQCIQNTGFTLCFMSKLFYFFWYSQLFLFHFCLACTLNRTPKTTNNNGLGSCLHFLLCLLGNQGLKTELCRFAVNLQVPCRKANRNLLKNVSNRPVWYILHSESVKYQNMLYREDNQQQGITALVLLVHCWI